MTSSNRARMGSLSRTPSLSSATGLQMPDRPPVSLTNIRVRPSSLDSYRINTQLGRTSSSSSSRLSQVRDVAVPQPMGQPRQGWFDMPPLNPPYAYSPSTGCRPIPAKRNPFTDRPLTRTSSSTLLDSGVSKTSNPLLKPQVTNEQGSFMPQVRKDISCIIGLEMRCVAIRRSTHSTSRPELYWVEELQHCGPISVPPKSIRPSKRPRTKLRTRKRKSRPI